VQEAKDLVERLLSEAWGAPVALDAYAEVLRAHEGYPTVARYKILKPSDVPSTVIAKRPGNWAPYDPDSAESSAWGFFNEWAALDFLSGAELAPAFYGGNRKAGVLAMEDLGDGDGLADALLGADATVAEEQLLAFADALARLHAFSASKVDAYERLRERLGPMRSGDEYGPHELSKLVDGVRAACQAVAMELRTPAEDDMRRAFEVIDSPSFRVLSHGDACPDNTRTDGAKMRFIDFWVARPRDAVLDGAYARAPFPTCWCVRRIPERIVLAMEDRYRSVVRAALPELNEGSVFHRRLVAALVLWFAEIIRWYVPHALEDDEFFYRDVHTRRQGIVLRWETLRAAAGQIGVFSDFTQFADDLVERLRDAWGGLPVIQPYPAFAN